MDTYINAWLECSKPSISIYSKNNSELIVYFNSESVHKLMDNGDICIEDFQTTKADSLTEISMQLIALKSEKTLSKQINKMGRVLKTKKQTLRILDNAEVVKISHFKDLANTNTVRHINS